MRNIISIIIAFLCIGTCLLTSSLMGIGMWFWIILGSGLFVGISQRFQETQYIGVIVAAFLSIISVFSVLLGLAATTAGGFFNPKDEEVLLLSLFSMIAFFGLLLVFVSKKSKREMEDE